MSVQVKMDQNIFLKINKTTPQYNLTIFLSIGVKENESFKKVDIVLTALFEFI